jgi:tetratricopeptide (TPR) repeat protein
MVLNTSFHDLNRVTRPNTAAGALFRACYLNLLLIAMSSASLLGQTTQPRAAEIQKYAEQATQALNTGNRAAAVDAYQSILRIDPGNVEARANLGMLAMLRGDWAGAEEKFREALKLRPSDWRTQALIGLCELHLGHVAEATNLLSESFPHLEDPQVGLEAGLRLAEIWYANGELEKAGTVLSQLQRLDPSNLDVLYANYRLHSDLALQAINTMAIAAPDSPQMHRALAEQLMNDGHLDGAIAEYRKALQSGTAPAEVHYEFGEALLEYSHLEHGMTEAQREFETALALDPADGRPECSLGQIELLRSNPKTAFDHYMRAQKLNARLTCANLGIATLLENEGKSQEAVNYLEAAAQSDPSNPEVRHRLALLYRELGRKEDADRELAVFQELDKIRTNLTNVFEEMHPPH